jgi:hypothetical protein
VGYTQWSYFYVRNCYIGENVYLEASNVSDIATYGNSKATVQNCYSLSTKVTHDIKNSEKNNHPGRKSLALAHHWAGNNDTNKTIIKNCYVLDGKLTGSGATLEVKDSYHTDETSNIGTIIPKEDMLGINALEYMPFLNIAPLKEKINILKVPYVNLPSQQLIEINSDIVLKEDGITPMCTMHLITTEDNIIHLEIKGNSINKEPMYEDYLFYKITGLTEEYDETCALKISLLDGEDSCFSFEIKNGVLEVCGYSTDTMETVSATYRVEVEKEIEFSSYTNDYTHPHLTSFAEGWKCIYDSERIAKIEEAIENLGGKIE